MSRGSRDDSDLYCPKIMKRAFSLVYGLHMCPGILTGHDETAFQAFMHYIRSF
jgi:hypothetical protein